MHNIILTPFQGLRYWFHHYPVRRFALGWVIILRTFSAVGEKIYKKFQKSTFVTLSSEGRI